MNDTNTLIPLTKRNVLLPPRRIPSGVRAQADRYFGNTLMILPNSPLYSEFFTDTNHDSLVREMEKMYNVTLDASYRLDVLNAMLTCFDFHGVSLRDTNLLVHILMRTQLETLRTVQERYRRNVIENETTKFLHILSPPESVCKRKDTLSFTEALFGPGDRNSAAFAQFRTG